MPNCPKCSKAMNPITFEGTTVDRCSGCGGFWFDALELEAVLAKRGANKVEVEGADVGRAMDVTSRINCPHCKGQMVRLGRLGYAVLNRLRIRAQHDVRYAVD